MKFAALLRELADDEQFAEGTLVAAKVIDMFSDYDEAEPPDFARLLFLGETVSRYALAGVARALGTACPESDVADVESMLDDLFAHAEDAVDVLFLRDREKAESDVKLRAVVEGARVLFVNPDGEAVDGYEITSVNAPGSTDTN